MFDASVRKLKFIFDVEWTTTTRIIYSLPILLSILLAHLLIRMSEPRMASIVSDSMLCTKIGKDVLDEGGSVADAAIAIFFCESLVLPHRVGIGGGFSAIIYMRNTVKTVVATPKAPNNFPIELMDDNHNHPGVAGITVPGALLGCWQLHHKYGILPWTRLLQPTINLCEKGLPKHYLFGNEGQAIVFDDYRNMAVQRIMERRKEEIHGEKIQFLALARTLRQIAKNGSSVFYNGSVGEDLIKDIQEEDGLLTMTDLSDYSVSWSDRPIKFRLSTHELAFTTPLPTSGAIVALVMNIIRNVPNRNSPIFWHKTVEALKHAYGLSFSLADIENEPNKHLAHFVQNIFDKMIDVDFASHLRKLILDERVNGNLSYFSVRHRQNFQSSAGSICITDPNGEAIVLTTDMLLRRGERSFYSQRTGILLNNQMTTFKPSSKHSKHLPASPNSFVRPGKRAFSAHSPVLVLYGPKAEVSFLAGASGDEMAAAQIITALIKHSLERKNAIRASNSYFFYPDQFEDKVFYQLATTEIGINAEILKYLSKVGHKVERIESTIPHNIRNVIVQDGANSIPEFTYRQQGGNILVKSEREVDYLILFTIVLVIFVMIMWLSITNVGETKISIALESIRNNEEVLTNLSRLDFKSSELESLDSPDSGVYNPNYGIL